MPDRRGRRRRREARLRILLWNVWVGNSPRVVRAALIVMAGLFRPHLICLQEAGRFTRSIPGYRRLAADDSKREDATQVIMLVRRRRRVRLVDHWPVYVPGKGWTYNGNRKPPRTFYAAVLWVSGVVWHVLNVHRCVRIGGGANNREWQAEDRTIDLWAGAVPKGDPAAIVGDWNDRLESHRPGTVHDLADRTDTRPLTAGGIDYALIRRCAGYIRELLRKFRSDHAPRFITLTAPRPRLEADLLTRRTTAEQQIPLPG